MDNINVFVQDDMLWVEWSAPKVVGPPVAYVIEWVSLVDEDMDWQKEPRNATKAYLKGEAFLFYVFKPLRKSDPQIVLAAQVCTWSWSIGVN